MITQRSTSPLMKGIFGNDIGMIEGTYNGIVSGILSEFPFLESAVSDCFGRTAFLLPHMSVEYGYHAVTGCFLSPEAREKAASFGIVCLAICVDDDIVDEYAKEGDHLKLVSNSSVSEILQHKAYSNVSGLHDSYSPEIVAELGRCIRSVTQYQHMDSKNITGFPLSGFDREKYLEAAHKTSMPVIHGLSLGIRLAGKLEYLPLARELGMCLGQTLQLFDDLIDLPDDKVSYSYPVTLPMWLEERNEGFDEIFCMADDNLRRALEVAGRFPFPGKLCEMIDGFVSVKSSIEKKLVKLS